MRSIELFTIGHSNHSSDQFLGLLLQHKIGVLVDIRRFPGSRKFPQFNRENLAEQLKSHGIEYVWMEVLGGRRPKVIDFQSPNTGLHNTSFRNYADYMLSANSVTGWTNWRLLRHRSEQRSCVPKACFGGVTAD